MFGTIAILSFGLPFILVSVLQMAIVAAACVRSGASEADIAYKKLRLKPSFFVFSFLAYDLPRLGGMSVYIEKASARFSGKKATIEQTQHYSQSLSIIDQKSSLLFAMNSLNFAFVGIFVIQDEEFLKIAFNYWSTAIILACLSVSTLYLWSTTNVRWSAEPELTSKEFPARLLLLRMERTIRLRIARLFSGAAVLFLLVILCFALVSTVTEPKHEEHHTSSTRAK